MFTACLFDVLPEYASTLSYWVLRISVNIYGAPVLCWITDKCGACVSVCTALIVCTDIPCFWAVVQLLKNAILKQAAQF